MSKVIVSDTSCLILLDKLNLLHLLQKLFGEIVITPEVQTEFSKTLPDWIRVESVVNTSLQKNLQPAIGPGEASAIAFASDQEECLLIMDDNKARKAAKSLALPYIGTLGLLVEAKDAGLIQAVLPVMEQIKKTNFRINKSLEDEVIKLAGEKKEP